ncbi:unnamed protein product, partial [Iphiclides podalirius]
MKNCCARECTTSRGTDCNPILHCFPNPEKECPKLSGSTDCSIHNSTLVKPSKSTGSTLKRSLSGINNESVHNPTLVKPSTNTVRDKIRRDEEANKSLKDSEQNLSSGGSYYEACGDDDNVLVVPLKTRVNGVLETVQQKVVSHESYLAVKEELKDAKEVVDVLKQKVEHLDILLKLKDERIEELQKQLERKQSRRREAESLQSNSSLPYDPLPEEEQTIIPVKFEPTKAMDISRIPRLEEWKIVLPKADLAKTASRHSTDIKKEEIEREPSVAIDSANLDDFRGVEGADLKESQDADEFKDSEETIAGAVALNIEITTENGPQITVI